MNTMQTHFVFKSSNTSFNSFMHVLASLCLCTIINKNMRELCWWAYFFSKAFSQISRTVLPLYDANCQYARNKYCTRVVKRKVKNAHQNICTNITRMQIKLKVEFLHTVVWFSPQNLLGTSGGTNIHKTSLRKGGITIILYDDFDGIRKPEFTYYTFYTHRHHVLLLYCIIFLPTFSPLYDKKYYSNLHSQ